MMSTMIEYALANMKYKVPNITNKENYLNIYGRYVPSVTEIIGKMNHNDSLMIWSNSIGLRGIRYTTYMDNAANLGTEAHAAIERFIKEKVEDNTNTCFLGFKLWYDNLINTGHFVKILGSELHIPGNWYGGTCDLLIDIDGKVYIVDFKTSNHVTYNYFLQLAGYKYLIEQELGINVSGGVIVLQLNKKEPGYNEYILLMNQKDHYLFIEQCTKAFLSLVYAYYQVTDVSNRFHTIFGDRKGVI